LRYYKERKAVVESTLDVLELRGVSGTPGDGPFIVIELTVREGRILAVNFQCNGCPPAQLAACGLATFVKGRTLEEALRLDAKDLDLLIGGLPDGKGHYAQMAVDALKSATEGLNL
jgi:NifU-like protein involved in Fe-S cluster formation